MRRAGCGLLALVACHSPPEPVAFQPTGFVPLTSGSKASLRGLHAVDRHIVWASGSGSTVLRSVDGGATFAARLVPGGNNQEVRDVHAFGAERAFLLGCQPARIFRTTDGGRTFAVVLDAVADTGDDKTFLNALSFWNQERGIAIGDPIDGRFLVYVTTDAGESWQRLGAGAPTALPKEGSFAASGTCLTVRPGGHAWIATGIGGARVWHTTDYGKVWSLVTTPLAFGEAAGIFSIAFRDGPFGVPVGVAVGGDYKNTDLRAGNAATSSDGGIHWRLVVDDPPRGYRSCVAWVPGRASTSWVAVGSKGCDFSVDDGKSWRALSDQGYHVVSFAKDGTGFAAGANGRVARLGFR